MIEGVRRQERCYPDSFLVHAKDVFETLAGYFSRFLFAKVYVSFDLWFGKCCDVCFSALSELCWRQQQFSKPSVISSCQSVLCSLVMSKIDLCYTGTRTLRLCLYLRLMLLLIFQRTHGSNIYSYDWSFLKTLSRSAQWNPLQ